MPALFALGAAATVLIGLVAAALLFLVFAVGLFNTLVTLRNRYKNAYAQIDVQLKRRYDLIPNLVETAKGYMRHERETLEAVINARNAAVTASQRAAGTPGDPSAMSSLSSAEGQLTGALGRLFALSEAYPDLKANQNMLALQEEAGVFGAINRGLIRGGHHGAQYSLGVPPRGGTWLPAPADRLLDIAPNTLP